MTWDTAEVSGQIQPHRDRIYLWVNPYPGALEEVMHIYMAAEFDVQF